MSFIKKNLHTTIALAILLAVLKASGDVQFDTIYGFGRDTNDHGSNPTAGLVQGIDDHFYGTTSLGGAHGKGTIFQMNADGSVVTMIAFDGTNGAKPSAELLLATDGNLYGTTAEGGTENTGTVFKLTTNGALTTLFSFKNAGTNGSRPVAGLIQAADGNLYGTTELGGTLAPNNPVGYGAFGYGTIFKMTTNGAITRLIAFNDTNGAIPSAALVQGRDGDFYGTTRFGGTNRGGAIFKTTTNGEITTLVSFNGSNGSYPSAALVEGLDGSFYGTTSQGGTNGAGTIFKMTTNGTLTTLISLGSATGYFPNSSLVLGNDGNFYGTTLQGNPTGGTVFRMTTNGVFNVLFLFSHGDGVFPNQIVLGKDGLFYGTTEYGGIIHGSNGSGTLFKITTNGTFTSLHSFSNSVDTDGYDPRRLIQGPGGLFYGTTGGGGANGVATFFSVTTNGVLNTLYSFDTSNFEPDNLVHGRDGNFYGTTPGGGDKGQGSIWKVTPAGVFTTIRSFDYNDDYGAEPNSLVPGSDGNLYGTTASGGPDGGGTFFKITTSGAMTILNSSLEQYQRICFQGRDGNFYGVAPDGGSDGYGSLFRITPSGAYQQLVSFNYDNGAFPNTLVQGNDGNFYGTTIDGGFGDNGTIFRMTASGLLVTIHTFRYDDETGYLGGRSPVELIQGTDGNFYGATLSGGTNENGMIFKCTPNGTLTELHSFGSDEEGYESRGIAQGKDHNLYGSQSYGGPFGGGTLFRLTFPHHPVILTQPASQTRMLGSPAAFSVLAEGSAPLSYQWRKSTVNLTNSGKFSGVNSSTLLINNVSAADAGVYSVVISNSFGSTISSNAILTVPPIVPEAVDATNLIWIFGGDADWTGQTDIAWDGLDAAQSGFLFDSQSSWLETTVSGPAIVSFWWKVSSESDYDFLAFSTNGTTRGAISGEIDWQQSAVTLDEGTHTLRWTYSKDLSVAVGQDRAWLDSVKVFPTVYVPVLQNVNHIGDTLSFTWGTQNGRMYQVQVATNLSDPNWVNLEGPITGTNSSVTISTPIGEESQKFHRVLLLPQ